MNSGIYFIKNLKNGKFYVGSSQNLKSRKYYHFNRLRNDRHPNSHLQRAYNKYGESQFLYEVKLITKTNLLLKEEQNELDKHWNSGMLYNINRYASATRNYKHSTSTKKN